MRVQVKKWGNSAAVRIPASVLEAVDLRVDQTVEINERNGRIVIEKAKGPSYDLDEMLARMKPETFHDDADFGRPKGREVW
ncbi:MAG: AbrB/MazE/SpoVT family DNA-binding domain-containing protein [Tagaea sp.]